MKKYMIGLASLMFLGVMGVAQAQNCTIDLDSNDKMQYDKKEVTVSASCKNITVNLKHTGQLPATAMGHNVVITKTSDMTAVSQASMKTGAPSYTAKDDKRIVAYTDMIGGGQNTKVSFSGNKLEAGGDYTFFCSFPGHSSLMKGKIVVTP